MLGQGATNRSATVIRRMIGAARSKMARTVPIPVLLEGRWDWQKNLLTGGPVLGQADGSYREWERTVWEMEFDSQGANVV
jgi:hypothetical protein